MDVRSDEGKRLTAPYFVGSTYPVFILADSAGNVINRWTGYTGADPFVVTLNAAIKNQITINQRYDRLIKLPALDDALFLAWYNVEIGENLEAAKLYRQAQTLRKNQASDYTYDIFQNTADAAWKGKITFDQLLPAADEVLIARSGDITSISNLARVMSNVARKTGRTGDIAKYLEAGIAASANRADPKSTESHAIFIADRILYVDRDTAKAIDTRKTSLGTGWESNPDRFYSFAKWCLERKIDLEEAESYARQAVERASAGRFKAAILNTLADIYEARGNIRNAIKTMEQASQQDPENDLYSTELARLRAKQNGSN